MEFYQKFQPRINTNEHQLQILILDAERWNLNFEIFYLELIMKRIFMAIDISVEARRKVSGYIETLRGEFPRVRVGWEKPEKIHLTLKFLGETDEKQLRNLIEAVEKTARRIWIFKMRISETGVFPSPKNARILWLGAKDEAGSLRELNKILESECETNNFPREKRTFKPHLTIARLREPDKSAELVGVHTGNEFATASFDVKELIIFQSELHPNGSFYTPIFRAGFL